MPPPNAILTESASMAIKPTILATKLRRLCDQDSRTQSQIGAAVGVSREQIRNYLTRNTVPSIAVLLKFARLGSVSVGWLVDDSQQIDGNTRGLDSVPDDSLMAEAAQRYARAEMALEKILVRAEKIDWKRVVDEINRTKGRDYSEHTEAAIKVASSLKCIVHETVDRLDSVLNAEENFARLPHGTTAKDGPRRLYFCERVNVILKNFDAKTRTKCLLADFTREISCSLESSEAIKLAREALHVWQDSNRILPYL